MTFTDIPVCITDVPVGCAQQQRRTTTGLNPDERADRRILLVAKILTPAGRPRRLFHRVPISATQRSQLRWQSSNGKPAEGSPVETAWDCVARIGATLAAMTRRNVAVADLAVGDDVEPKRFGVRDLRNDTAAVLEEAERTGAVYITRNGEVVAKLVPHRAEPDTRTPTRRLLDRVAGLTGRETGWADEHAAAKRAEIEAQGDDAWG
jgi:prevent-host-death family protein